MWAENDLALEKFEESVVDRGYIIAFGKSVGYSLLLDNKLFGRSIFGDVFLILKVNEDKPLKVRQNSLNGSLHINPVGESYSGVFPARVRKDSMVWNAAMFLQVPGEGVLTSENDGSKEDVREFVLKNSVLIGERKYSMSLVGCFESSLVDFDGNYSNSGYSFVPPSQVGTHLFSWLSRDRNIRSHDKTFNQRVEGRFQPQYNLQETFLNEIMPSLEERFGEQLIFKSRFS